MTNRFLAAGLVALGVAAGALGAEATRPHWNYHNGNTLLGQTPEYRRGFFIGVVDGYLQAHARMTRSAETGLWLDRCLSGGWTANHTTGVLDRHLDGAVMQMKNPAAEIVLDGLEKACAAAK